MITGAHKDLLATLARQHAKDVSHALQLARATFEPTHPTVQSLSGALKLATETLQELEAEESSRRVA
jgi:hypothetical protein